MGGGVAGAWPWLGARPRADRARLERLSDGLLALLPLMVAWLAILNGPAERHAWIMLAVATAQTAALACCRRFPLTVLLVVIALEIVLIVLDAEIFVGFLVATFALGTWGKPVQQRIGLTVGLSLLALGMVISIAGGSPVGFAVLGITSVAVMFVGFWLGGQLGARQRDRIRELEAERAQVVRRERALLARELHDILNHSVTAMVLDATAAAETGADVPETLDRVARTGRNSLAELRRLLGVLRADSSVTGHDPLAVPPGLAQIDALVSATPLDVTVVRHGSTGGVDASIEHAAYRVVQEALTNVVKHAGPVATTVSLSFTAGHLTVSVVNERPVIPGNPGTGLGLLGMRERVSLVGGTLAVCPRPDGFEVRAVLPVRSAACSA